MTDTYRSPRPHRGQSSDQHAEYGAPEHQAEHIAVEKLTMAEFLRAYEAHGQDGGLHLIDQGHPPKVVWAKASKAARKGYYEYGVSIPWGWLTPEGRAFLAAQTDGSGGASDG